jgi:tight adherence protein B
MDINTIAVAFLAAAAVGGVAWVFVYPYLSGEARAEKRKELVARSEPQRASRARSDVRSKRDQVEDSIKEIERKQKNEQKKPISVRIAQAGLSWSMRQFIMFSATIGLGLAALSMTMGAPEYVAAALAFVGGFGIPRWYLNFRRKRREKAFLHEFPNSVDVIVRGIKAGLPLVDCLKIIASESQEPVKSEFKQVIEMQAIGIPLGEAILKLYERMPLAEANFFGITIAIQQKAGGNLSETLGNLSKVLRDRKKMKAKIAAMSMEAKASASIIACLPPAVMFLVYVSSPGYMDVLWTTPIGRVVMAGCLAWMLTGVLVMKKMINFDF